MNFFANKKTAEIYRKTIDLSCFFCCYFTLIVLRRISVAVPNKKTPTKIGSMVFSSPAVGSVVFPPELLGVLVPLPFPVGVTVVGSLESGVAFLVNWAYSVIFPAGILSVAKNPFSSTCFSIIPTYERIAILRWRCWFF